MRNGNLYQNRFTMNHLPINTINDVICMIRSSNDMMSVLNIAKSLNLNDWWIGAGFVRNRLWDIIHNFYPYTPYNDIDVIYHDPSDLDGNTDKKFEYMMKDMNNNYNWSVSNQARMHVLNDAVPYDSCKDAVRRWPETSTAIAVKLNENDKIILFTPYGISDIINLKVKPTPYFYNKKDIYENRIKKKNWKSIWPLLDIYHFE